MTNRNDAVLSTVKPVADWLTWYKPLLRAFTKAHGSKPSDAMLTAATALANKHKRPGVECLFIAMCLRDEGCTVPQFTSVATSGLGEAVGPANNKRKALVKAKWLTETVAQGGKPYAYQLTITPKGATALTNVLAAVAEASAGTGSKAGDKAVKRNAKKQAKRKAKGKPQAPVDGAALAPVDVPPTVDVLPVAEGSIDAPQA